MKKVTQLPIVVTFNVKVVEHDGVSYVRIRDISDALGIKQPFEFTSTIRKTLGEVCVLTKEDTKDFRLDGDTSRTPYIMVMDMLDFLEQDLKQLRNNDRVEEIKSVLEYHLFKQLNNFVKVIDLMNQR